MMTRDPLRIAAVVAALLAASIVAAEPPAKVEGGMSTGGGAAVVCRGPDRKIVTARLLDLYEGEVRFGYRVDGGSGDARAQLKRVIARLPTAFQRTLVTEFVADVAPRARFLRDGVVLGAPGDLGESYGTVKPDGCDIEGVGFYEEDGTLKIAQPIFRKLTETDRAAFFLHEAAYKIARVTEGQSSSARSRRFVASLFDRGEADADRSRRFTQIISNDEGSTPIFPVEGGGWIIPRSDANRFMVSVRSPSAPSYLNGSVSCRDGNGHVREVQKPSTTDLEAVFSEACMTIDMGLYNRESRGAAPATRIAVAADGHRIETTLDEIALPGERGVWAFRVLIAHPATLPPLPILP